MVGSSFFSSTVAGVSDTWSAAGWICTLERTMSSARLMTPDSRRLYAPRRLERPLAGYGIDRLFCQALLGGVDARVHGGTVETARRRAPTRAPTR